VLHIHLHQNCPHCFLKLDSLSAFLNLWLNSNTISPILSQAWVRPMSHSLLLWDHHWGRAVGVNKWVVWECLMFPVCYTADTAFKLHSCLIAHRSRLLEGRKQARVFLIACTDLIGWKHFQPFVFLPGKKACYAGEQSYTGLGSLQLWILLGQHHQS
jgi:hypothetical protein